MALCTAQCGIMALGWPLTKFCLVSIGIVFLYSHKCVYIPIGLDLYPSVVMYIYISIHLRVEGPNQLWEHWPVPYFLRLIPWMCSFTELIQFVLEVKWGSGIHLGTAGQCQDVAIDALLLWAFSHRSAGHVKFSFECQTHYSLVLTT